MGHLFLPVIFAYLYDSFIFRSKMEESKTIIEECEQSEEMPPPAAPTSQQKAELERIEEQKLKTKFPGTSVRSSMNE